MTSVKLKSKKPSLVEITRKYANDEHACQEFFIHAFYPDGWVCDKCGCSHCHPVVGRNNVWQCDKCGHQQYLFAGTILQDNKLPLYKLILGLYLFFVANKGVSAVEMRSFLDVNYKTALLLCRKCRVLMAMSDSEKILDSMFYEADSAFIGSESSGPGKAGNGTDQQPFMAILSTGEENNYPHYVKLYPIPTDNSDMTNRFLSKSMVLSKDRVLNTDGKRTFNILKDRINVNNCKIDYKQRDHRLHWLNIIIGDVKNQITGIYHGVSKCSLPLFLKEQEYRINHRFTGKELLNKIQSYLCHSFPISRKAITKVLHTAEPYFTPSCV